MSKVSLTPRNSFIWTFVILKPFVVTIEFYGKFHTLSIRIDTISFLPHRNTLCWCKQSGAEIPIAKQSEINGFRYRMVVCACYFSAFILWFYLAIATGLTFLLTIDRVGVCAIPCQWQIQNQMHWRVWSNNKKQKMGLLPQTHQSSSFGL